jgi:hypothetical protein
MTSSGADFYKDVTLNGSSSGTAKINIGNNFYLSHVNSTGITTFNHSIIQELHHVYLIYHQHQHQQYYILKLLA